MISLKKALLISVLFLFGLIKFFTINEYINFKNSEFTKMPSIKIAQKEIKYDFVNPLVLK